jgi:hypothetical protein
MRHILQLSILLTVLGASAASGADRLAQNVVVPTPPPPPQLLPQISTTTSCLVTCDTQAMNCQNACVVVGPVVIPNPAGPAPCNLNCTTQQLVCKQACNR